MDNIYVFDRLCFIYIIGFLFILFCIVSGYVFVLLIKKRMNEKKYIFIYCCYLNNFISYSFYICLLEDVFILFYEMFLICKMFFFCLLLDILLELVFYICYVVL